MCSCSRITSKTMMEVKFSRGTETVLITTLTSHGRENSRRVEWLLHDDRLRMPHRFSRRQLLQVKPTHVANIGRNHSNDRDDETVKKRPLAPVRTTVLRTYLMLLFVSSKILFLRMYLSSSSRFCASWSATRGSHPNSLIIRMTLIATAIRQPQHTLR